MTDFIEAVRELKSDLVNGEISLTKEELLSIFKAICWHVLDCDDSNDSDRFVELIIDYMLGDDVKYFVLNSLLTIFKDVKREERILEERFAERGFKLLTAVKLVVPGQRKRKRKLVEADFINLDESGKGTAILVKNPSNQFLTSSLSYGKLADLFASVWLLFLSFKVN